MNSGFSFRAFQVAIVLGAGSLVLAGCGVPATPYSDLNRTAAPSDELPESLVDRGAIDAESARFVGEYKGTRVWVSLGASDDHACLLIAPINGDAQVACDIGGHDISLSENGAVKYLLVPGRGEEPDEDHFQLGQNVYVVPK